MTSRNFAWGGEAGREHVKSWRQERLLGVEQQMVRWELVGQVLLKSFTAAKLSLTGCSAANFIRFNFISKGQGMGT